MQGDREMRRASGEKDVVFGQLYHSYVISIGSNLPTRDACVEAAIGWLRNIGSLTADSGTYITLPFRKTGAPYANRVVKILTPMASSSLEKLCKQYEISQGRTPEARAEGKVHIDIDIVIADDEVLRPDELNRDYFTSGYIKICE